MRHCPKCGSEYQDWVMTCLDCASPLADGAAKAESEEDGSIDDNTGGQTEAREEASAQLPEGGEEAEEYEEEEEVELPPELTDKLEGYVDEYIDPDDFLTPQPVGEYDEPEEIIPRAELVSVLQTETTESVRRAAKVLHEAGIKVYLTEKPGIFNNFSLLLVEKPSSETALQILKETQNGYLVPIDPDVEDPELKDAPVINLDEESSNGEKPPSLYPEDRNLNSEQGRDDETEQEDDILICPLCDSKNIESKTSFFSRKAKLKCRECGHQWQIEL